MLFDHGNAELFSKRVKMGLSFIAFEQSGSFGKTASEFYATEVE